MLQQGNHFSRSQKLKSRKKLQDVFGKGARCYAGGIKLLYLAETTDAPAVSCGVGVSSRYFKHAVDRNRIKRLLREAFRLQQHPLQAFAIEHNKLVSLFILYTGKELPVYDTIYKQVGNALHKLTNRGT